jgi:hypothetical protein
MELGFWRLIILAAYFGGGVLECAVGSPPGLVSAAAIKAGVKQITKPSGTHQRPQ